MDAAFDLDAIFDEDYLYFYEEVLPEARTEREADTIVRLLDLEAGARVLELGCGHGRICNALASRGMEVTGLDRSTRFLELARADAAARGLAVTYLEGDMRDPVGAGSFDAVVIWFTTFGYFTDAGDEKVLAAAFAALKPGGRHLIEQNNRYGLLRLDLPVSFITRRGDDMLIDTTTYDGLADCATTERIIVRAGAVRRLAYTVRLYGFSELATLLERVGFTRPAAFGQNGEAFTLRGKRLITRAEKMPPRDVPTSKDVEQGSDARPHSP